MDKSSNQLEAFFSNYPLITFNPRERLKRPNERGMLVRYIKSGYINVHTYAHCGREISLAYLGPKQYKNVLFGYSTFIDKYYISALTEVKLWRVPRSDYLEYVEKNPHITMELSESLFNIIGHYISQIEWLKCGDSQIKVAAFLMNLAKNFSRKSSTHQRYLIDIPLTHQMIAEHTGLTRETVSLQLSKLRKLGLIEYKDGYIEINQLPKLTELVERVI